MYINEEDQSLVADHPQERHPRAKLHVLTIVIGTLIFFALTGAMATFWMWRSELVEQRRNDYNITTPSPSPTPTSIPLPNAPEAPTSIPLPNTPEAPTAAPASVGLNQTFSSRMTVAELMTTLQKLQDIAYANNGTRYAGSLGYNATGQWLIDTLNSYNYFKVERQDFSVPKFVRLAQPTLVHVSPTPSTFTYGTDFVDFEFSGSSDVIASVSVVKRFGCHQTDWAGFPAGNIALVLQGECDFAQQSIRAVAAKASALLICGHAASSVTTASTSTSLALPALYLSNRAGESLLNLCAIEPVTLRVTASGHTTHVGTFNIIADTLAGPVAPVVVVGAHLDAVPAGPGINDDGTGTATLLALARIVAETSAVNLDSSARLRLAWWGAEELGMLGSYHYVNDLRKNHPDQLAHIALNINLDTLGSPNFFRGIHNGSTAPEDVRHGSALIQALFEEHFQRQGLPFIATKFAYRSDYAAFIDRGIPVGGVFTGAEAIKTMKQRTVFGGLANTAYDPCYHRMCDTIDNVSTRVLDEMAQAVAEVTAVVLFNPSILAAINPTVAKNSEH